MTALHESDSIVVNAEPRQLYDLVADVTRMGEWSPVCTGCSWEPGHGLHLGGRFTGRNEWCGQTWETACEVVVAEPEREFAFVVLETDVRWGYHFTVVSGGTRVTETWDIPNSAVAVWTSRAGAAAQAQIADRRQRTRSEIAATLAEIKRAAESM